MMFEEFMKDVVILRKQNGIVCEGIKACVDSQIHIDLKLNVDLPPIESGDMIEHKQSNGVTEQYQVLDPCYYDDDVFGKHYQCNVKKFSAIERRPQTIYNINATQANVASDSATIHAVQNNGIDYVQVKSLIEAVKQAMGSEMPREDVKTVMENLDVLEEQLVAPAPKKAVINSLLAGIKVIVGTAEFYDAVNTLKQFVEQFFK